MNSQARIETHQALQALEDLDDCARMDVGISATGPYDLLRRYIQQQDRLALSHAAGQDGEQCRAASGVEEIARQMDAMAGHIQASSPEQKSERLRGWASMLRALSRGVPEDTKDAQRFRDLCELVQAGEWALCEVEITDKYGTVKENWQDGLSDIPQFCDTWASRAASWRKVRTESEQKAAIAAQRKEG